MLPHLKRERREAILGAIEAITDGKSLRQLYHDYDVLKLRAPKSKVTETDEEEEDKEPTEEEIAEALKTNWQAFATTALDYIEDEEHSWTALPKVERENLIGILEPFVKKLKASLK